MILTALAVLSLLPVSAHTPRSSSGPEQVFEELWRTFDRVHPRIAVEDSQWDALYQLYRPRVDADTSDAELFEILADMLGHLDDNHVMLQTPKGHPDENLITGDLSFRDGALRRNRDNAGYSVELIDEAYVAGTLESRLRGTFRFGRLSRSVAYLQLSAFDFREPTAAAMDEFMQQAGECDAIVVDLRGNGGGSTEAALEILGRFSARARTFAYRSLRRPHGPAAFSERIPLVIEPTGTAPFAGSVFVLTSRFSTSAADLFALGARTLPRTLLVGEATSGSFSTILGLRLSNGWLFSLPYERVTDHRNRSWEGVGVQPDLYAVNTAADVSAGRDRVLELAAALAYEELEPRGEDPETWHVTRSLTDALGRWLEELDTPAEAVARLRAESDDGYLAAEELWALACDRMDAGGRDQVLAILGVLFERLDGEWMFAVPGRDWNVLLDANDAEVSALILEHAAKLDPDFPLGGRLRARAVEGR